MSCLWLSHKNRWNVNSGVATPLKCPCFEVNPVRKVGTEAATTGHVQAPCPPTNQDAHGWLLFVKCMKLLLPASRCHSTLQTIQVLGSFLTQVSPLSTQCHLLGSNPVTHPAGLWGKSERGPYASQTLPLLRVSVRNERGGAPRADTGRPGQRQAWFPRPTQEKGGLHTLSSYVQGPDLMCSQHHLPPTTFQFKGGTLQPPGHILLDFSMPGTWQESKHLTNCIREFKVPDCVTCPSMARALFPFF